MDLLIPGKELDLSLGTGQFGRDHPDIKEGPTYLCKIRGSWFLGTFSLEWYGPNFNGWYNPVGLQYDAPGHNASNWERIILVDLEAL